MAEREVFVRWKFGGDDPEAELGRVRDGFRKVGESGKEAGKETATGFQPVSEELADVDRAGKSLYQTMERLAKAEAGGNLASAGKLAATASVQLDQLRAAAERAGLSGTEAGRRISEGMKLSEAAIKGATVQAAKLRDAAGDLKAQSDQTAKGFEAMAGAGGSFEGMLSKMADSSSPATAGLAKVGFAGVAVAAAFKLGWEAGEKLKEFFPVLLKLDVSGWFAKVLTGQNAAAISLSDYNVKARSLIGIQNETKMALENATEALRASVPAFGQASKAQTDAAESAKLFAAFLEASAKAGQTAEQVAKGNAQAIAAWAASIRAADGDLGRLNAQQLAAVRVAEAEVAAVQKLAKVTEAYYKSTTEAAEKKLKTIEATAKKTIEAADAEASALEREIRAAKQRNASREEILALEAKYAEAVQKIVDASREQEAETLKLVAAHRELASARAELTARDEEGARATELGAQAVSASAEVQAQASEAIRLHMALMAEAQRNAAQASKEQEEALLRGGEVSQKAAERLRDLTAAQKEATDQANKGVGAFDDFALAVSNFASGL